MVTRRNAYAINHNFKTVFEGMNEFQKSAVKQKHLNRNMVWVMAFVSIYIWINEKRQYEQEKELERLAGELDELKGEQAMR